jgi:hypothetical protein
MVKNLIILGTIWSVMITGAFFGRGGPGGIRTAFNRNGAGQGESRMNVIYQSVVRGTREWLPVREAHRPVTEIVDKEKERQDKSRDINTIPGIKPSDEPREEASKPVRIKARAR